MLTAAGHVAGGSAGQVAHQQWEIDTTQSQQVISVTFSGAQEGQQTIVRVQCDPSADSPTFTVKGEVRTQVYELHMTSKYACAKPGQLNELRTQLRGRVQPLPHSME